MRRARIPSSDIVKNPTVARLAAFAVALAAGAATAADAPAAKPPARGSSVMSPDEMTDKPAPAPSTLPATTPATIPATTQAASQPSEFDLPPLGERMKVSVTLKSASIARVPLRRVTPYPPGRKGPMETQSQDFLLVVRLEVRNDCDRATLVFVDPGATTPETSPSLEDTTGQGFGSVNFGDFEPIDAIRKVALKPGEATPDVLAFAPPPADVTALHLRIPLKISGRDRVLEVDLDPKEIKRK